MCSQDADFVRIAPPKGLFRIDWSELWHYRELLYFFCWRDLKVRYKQTFLGVAWALIIPAASTFVFTVIFGRIAKLPTDGLPQPIFYMSGLVIWRYFSQSLTLSSNSLVGGAGLFTKIYFPRLLIPTATIFTGLIDFLIAFFALLLLMLYLGVVPSVTVVLLPALVLVAVFTSFGIGLWLSSLCVRYRDIRYIVPFIIQLWMYATVIVPFNQFGKWADHHHWGSFKYLYGLNPMAGVVEGFRWCLFHRIPGATVQPPWELLAFGAPVSLACVLFGVTWFKRAESHFADIV